MPKAKADLVKSLQALIQDSNFSGYLRVKITPKAAQTHLKEQLEDHTWKIAIKEAPENGRANEALCKYLSKILIAEIKIISGKTERLKLLKIIPHS
jgi:uncharacterized protein (TIGR00251 family)